MLRSGTALPRERRAMTDDIALLSAAALVERYRAGTLSPVDVVRACLDRIAAHNPVLNAFRSVDAGGALAAAEKSAQRYETCKPKGPLDGVPVSIKDTLLARGWPTLRGSRTVDPDQPWREDAPAVQRLRETGAILMGRTTTPEFGWKGVTDSPLTGITRNPWNPELTPGGSSGGAAAAAAAGMAAINLGTDGGGSIRIPASFTGVYGFKPSYGRVPAYPISAFGTLSVVGPLTRTVADAALAMQVLSRPDPRDWTAVPCPAPDFSEELDRGVAGLRIAFAPALAGEPVDLEVAARVRSAADAFADLGADVTETAAPLDGAGRCFGRHWAVGAALAVAAVPEEKRALMDPGLLAMAAAAAGLSAVDDGAAVLERHRLGNAMVRFHETYDLLLTPTEPIVAFAAGHDTPPDGPYRGWEGWTPFTYPFNLTMQPAATVPCGLTAAGLPVGLQIVARLHRDDLVLRASRAFEQARPWPLPALPG